MKKYLPLILLTAILAGCEQPQDQASTEPVATEMPAGNSSSEAKALMDQGMEFFAKEDVVSALKSFDDAIKVEPNNPENYLVLGQIYLRLRNYDKAVDTFKAGTRVGPEEGEIFYFLGAANAVRFHLAQGQEAEEYKQEGIAAAERAVEIFISQKDEVRLKTSLALLKSLQENGDIGKTPPQVE